MIGAMSGGEGFGNAASIYFTQSTPAIGGLGLGSLTVGEGAGGASPASAQISGPGQLLSNLQQLQTNDPTQFQQTVTQIATQLDAAAQQSQGPQSSFLSNLASKFQDIANGGSLSQLAPQQHHRHRHAMRAYSQNSQSSSQGLAGLAQVSGSNSSSNNQSVTPSSSVSLQQLFTTISSEVSTALAGK